MITGGVEVTAGGGAPDRLFGPMIAFGLGGIHVEVLADVCFRVTPLTNRNTAEMVRSIRGHRLLEGYRGHRPADIGAIEAILLRISRLVEELPEIGDMDLNPIPALPPRTRLPGGGCPGHGKAKPLSRHATAIDYAPGRSSTSGTEAGGGFNGIAPKYFDSFRRPAHGGVSESGVT